MSAYLCDFSAESLLGTGSYGDVYKGYRKSNGTVVAIKKFKIGKKLEQREKQILESIVHEHIVRVFELVGDRQKTNRVVMEYCDGGSMIDFLYMPRNRYGLNEKDACDFLGQFSAGLKFLIDQNVVHRDIKPHNIMRCITDDGSVLYKITDFGLSRQLSYMDETMTSQVGSRAYMHPKVIQHNSYHADEVDLWSTGVTIYQMITGNLPFHASLSEILDKPQEAISCIGGRPPKYDTVLPKDCKVSLTLTSHTITMMLKKLFNIKSPTSFVDYFALVAILQNEIQQRKQGLLYINFDTENIGYFASKCVESKLSKLDFSITTETFLPICHLSMETLDVRKPLLDNKYKQEQSLCYKMIRQCQRLQMHVTNSQKLHNLLTEKESNTEDKVTQFEILLKMIVILKDSADNMIVISSKKAVLNQLTEIEKRIEHHIKPLHPTSNDGEIASFGGVLLYNSVERIRIECEKLYYEFDKENGGNFDQREAILKLRSVYLKSLEKQLEDIFGEIKSLELATTTLSHFINRCSENKENDDDVAKRLSDELQTLYTKEIKPQTKPSSDQFQTPGLPQHETEALVKLSEENRRLIMEHKDLFDTLMRHYNSK